VRRGAAWPAERPSSWLVVREAVSRWQVAHRRAVMVAKRRRRCPQEHGWGGPAGALGMVAQEVRMPAVPSSACRGPGPASGVHCLVRVSSSTRACPRGCCPVSGVGVWASRCPVSGVQRGCPVSVGFRVHCVRPGGCGEVAVGRQPHGWDGRRRRGRLRCPRPVRRRPGSEPGGRARRRPCWASGGVGLDLAVVGGGWVVARSSAWATRIGWMCWGIVRWVASRGAQRGSDYPAWSSCED
jgi:hypothetical protein